MRHTALIPQEGYNIWITRLTSVDPTNIEYRFTFSDGVIRYLTIQEIINSPFNYLAEHIITDLVDAIDECRLKLMNKELYFNELN